jgi:hypothetical protein
VQTARGLRSTATGITKDLLLKELARVKWFLWHGNVVRADDTLSNLIDEVDWAREEDRKTGRPPQLVLKKLSRALEEFGTYIDNNAGAIVNYGERRRCGERISTGFVESTINRLIAKRFVKNSKCDGRLKVPTCYCRCACTSSMTSSAPLFSDGIQSSAVARRHNTRRSTPKKWMPAMPE